MLRLISCVGDTLHVRTSYLCISSLCVRTLLPAALPLLSGNALVASRRSKPYYGRASSSELPQGAAATSSPARISVGNF